MINRLCIIGVGLIGGSLALALKKTGFCREIIGAGRNKERLEKALSLGVVDRIEMDYAKAVHQSDMVFVAVPLGAMKDVFKQIATALPAHAIVTDAGSAKLCVIQDAEKAFGLKINQFVPGHPIAGTEQSGVEAAFDSLFQRRRVILTPLESNSPDAVKKVRAMWQAAGAEIDEMDARHHDLILAGTSHLPHILAFSLVDCLHRLDDVDEVFKFAAGGFRDFTRIASSDPTMWRDICLYNRDAVLAMMQRFQNEVDEVRDAVEKEDGKKLIEIFSRAKQARDDFFV